MAYWKYIEHEKYSAPIRARYKVAGEWIHKRLTHTTRDFRQCVRNRVAAMSTASRYIAYAHPEFKGYPDIDQLVRQFIEQGERKPSTMAKRKYFPHRPKPANNTAKNRSRRAKLVAWSQALYMRMPKRAGTSPSPPIVRNGVQGPARGNGGGNWGRHASGSGARECARRRRQMRGDIGRPLEEYM